MLTEAGYEVVVCLDGNCAIEMLRRNRFDLVITDIYMPDKDGLEVIRETRQICPDVPVLAVSGVSDHRDMLAVAGYLGACRTLRKPLSKPDLLGVVGAAIGAAPAGRPGTSAPCGCKARPK